MFVGYHSFPFQVRVLRLSRPKLISLLSHLTPVFPNTVNIQVSSLLNPPASLVWKSATHSLFLASNSASINGCWFSRGGGTGPSFAEVRKGRKAQFSVGLNPSSEEDQEHIRPNLSQHLTGKGLEISRHRWNHETKMFLSVFVSGFIHKVFLFFVFFSKI